METRPFLKKGIKTLLNIANIPLQVGKTKIFCISMQRNGTTSVGDFLADHGFRVARWSDSRRNNWSYKWHIGDYESIFNSIMFRSCIAFEDGPWWLPDFYRILNFRFPNSKFILFYRDSDTWFNSMISHSDGKTLGNTYRHCRIYRRISEYYTNVENDPNFKPTENEIDKLMSIDESLREHYKKIYEEHNKEVIEYFNKYGHDKLFCSRLEENDKWQKLGVFIGIQVAPNYQMHSNKSNSNLT